MDKVGLPEGAHWREMKPCLLHFMHFKDLLRLFIYFNLISVPLTGSAKAKFVLEYKHLQKFQSISTWHFSLNLST